MTTMKRQRMKRMKSAAATLLLAFCLAIPIQASGEPAKPKAATPAGSRSKAKRTAKKKAPPTRLTFGDDVVNAGRANGGGTMVKGRVAPTHSQLIPIRTDFVPELLKSAEDL